VQVLVVEDDIFIRSLLTEILSDRGHEAVAVDNGAEAWARYQAQPTPLVLLDWNLPIMDGLEVLRRIRASPDGPGTVVIMITAHDRPEDLATVLAAGADDYVAKPFELDLAEVRLTIAERQVEIVAQRRKAEAALTHQALHDGLTDLPNRVLWRDRLEQAFAVATRESTPLGLLLIDLDGFKAVNDTWGHQMGDHLLQIVARRIRDSLRASDTGARLGGDEFAVILPVTDLAGAEAAARKLEASLHQPIAVEGQTLPVRASIGVALFPHHATDPERRFRQADVAMYQAKRGGGGVQVAAFSVADPPPSFPVARLE
jgi:diguanylate cyclase (GGDEF)-like protein